MRVLILEDPAAVGAWAAAHIAQQINDRAPSAGDPFVLGLPTGSTPLATYRELIRLYREGAVSFEHVISFNMDEYVGLPPEHPQSYHAFMWENFFSHVDIRRENTNILDGMAADLEAECAAYEEKIGAVGGIDFFLGGIGADGHIAFNEPGSSLGSRTRVKSLTTETIQDNARFFDGDLSRVPRTALTVGVATVMDARQVMILATGRNKAAAIQQTVEGAVSHMCTVSALQLHRRAILVCDEDAVSDLKVGTYRYFKDIERGSL